jgi:hypothetical protein
MKKSLEQKRNEWQIDEDVQHDWQQMRGLLDVHMPVVDPGGNNGGGSTNSTLPGIGGIRLLSVLIVAVSVATVIYFTVKHTKANKPLLKQQTEKSSNYFNNKTGSAIKPLVERGNGSAASASNHVAGNGLIGDKSGHGLGVNDKITSGSNPPDNYIGDANVGHASSQAKVSAAGSVTKPGVGGISSAINAKSNGGSSIRNNTVSMNNHTHGRNGMGLTRRPGSAVINGNAKHSKLFLKYNLKNGYAADKPINAGRSSSTKTDLKNDGRNTAGDPIKYAGMSDDQQQYYGTAMDLVIPHLSDANNVLLAKPNPMQFKYNTIASTAEPGKGPKSNTESRLQLGILVGVNVSGSFTAKSENANIYGSLPVDLFLGLFANYTINNKWALNVQPKLLSPQAVSGTYMHANESKIDLGQILTMTDSRKVYFVDMPLHVVYKTAPNVSLMGGLAMSIPAKQINALSAYSTGGAKKDSAYYVKVNNQVNATKYNWQPNLGVSVGVSITYQRLFFNATGLKALKTQNITSDLGGYTFSHDALQLSVGFRLK